MEQMSMADLRPGQRGRVLSVSLSGGLLQRLRELGLVEGTEVTCMHIAPSGSPAAFWIRGTLLALRREDCGAILVAGCD